MKRKSTAPLNASKRPISFTDEDLRRFLEQEQMTMEQYRNQIKEQVLRTRLVNYQVKSKIVITEEEIRAYYDSHPELYGGKTRYHLRNILMRVPDFATDAEKQAVQRTDATDPFPDRSRGILCRFGPKV
jgi:parvulin-like peptidyl-prolyl isomerase